MIEKKQNIWGSLAVGYFFLAGTASMIPLLLACIHFTKLYSLLPGSNIAVSAALFAAVVFAGVGGLLLLMELTHKFRFPMVFAKPKSLMSMGAYALSCFILLTFILFIMSLIPEQAPRIIVGIIYALVIPFSLFMAAYPALEMAEARGRTFWGAGLVPLFLLSNLTCACGVLLMLGFHITTLFIILAVLNLIVLAGYMWSAELTGMSESRKGTDLLIKGEYKMIFIAGAVICGLALPIVTAAFIPVVAGLLALVGGLCFRYTFMKAGVNKGLPGDENEIYPPSAMKTLGQALEARWNAKKIYTKGGE